MQSAGLAFLTMLTLAAAVYAHYRLPFHSAGPRQLWFARMLLIGVGVAFGWFMSQSYFSEAGFMRALIFLSAFGAVHIPAACILFIKRQRKIWK